MAVRKAGIDTAIPLWADPSCHHVRLHSLDPHLAFCAPSTVSRNFEAVIHRPRLDEAYTTKFGKRIEVVSTPACRSCDCEETFSHVLFDWPRYNFERRIINWALFGLDSRPLTTQKSLGSSNFSVDTAGATRDLMTFLTQTDLVSSI